jgi:hypothetical protein
MARLLAHGKICLDLDWSIAKSADARWLTEHKGKCLHPVPHLDKQKVPSKYNEKNFSSAMM